MWMFILSTYLFSSNKKLTLSISSKQLMISNKHTCHPSDVWSSTNWLHLKQEFSLFLAPKIDMPKWGNPAHTGWLTMSQVENEWTQPNSLYGEPKILQLSSTHHVLVS